MLKDKFNIDYDDLSEVYLLPIKVCIETSLSDFQLKVLNCITCTNILLKKFGVVDSDIFSFCNVSREEIEHMLLNCSVSQNFWNDFKWYWCYNTKETIMLSLKDIIVGAFGNGNDFLNDCILVGKSLIYHCKRNKVNPVYSHLNYCYVKNITLNCILRTRITFFMFFLRSGSSSLCHIDM